jgi:tape measure domain-containing protein
MSKRLSFSIAVNLLTENFKKGTNIVKNSLRSMQMQVITFAAALGAGGLGISGLLSRFRDVARETSRVLTALKNVSGGTKGFADNLRFANDLAKKYGMAINTLTGNFASFTASATQANMPMDQQRKVFESLSRASAAFGLSAQQTDGVFLALSQMMGKGKISMEELRKQMGEKIPIAVQAMAKALGVSIAQMEKLIGSGKVMSANVLPKFADALNEMIPNVDTDNLETSLNRLSNMFGEIVNASGFQNKYKALIDGLTSLLESASKNIQNIIVGIVAAIGFVVTRGLTKVYQGYATTGQQIVANATTTHNKLRTAIAARVEAEKNLESLKLQHAQVVGAQQIALQRKIDRAKQTLSARTAAVNIAHENAKVAAAAAAAIKSRRVWVTTWAAISGSAKKLMVGLKSMWNSFAPAIIISAIIAIAGHIRNLYNESKRIKNIFKEYRKEAESVGLNNAEIKSLQTQLSIMNDKKRSQDEINNAQAALQKMLGIENKSQKEINKLVENRIKLLKTAAEADFYAQESTRYTDANRKLIKNAGLTETQIASLAEKREEYKQTGKRVPFSNEVAKIWKENTGKDIGYDVSGMIDLVDEFIENKKVIQDAESYLTTAINDANKLNSTPVGDDPDDKAKRAAERRLEALRKMTEEERQLQIDKQKFDIEMRQKAIDLDEDSFEKRTKQTLLNLEKEKLAVEETQADLLKKQKDYAKEVYASMNGTDKIGFEDYFAGIKNDKFKNKKGVDIMPEGLRPEDIVKKTTELTKAAEEAKEKGLKDINKDLSTMLREQQLMFASDLDKKLADLDTYYNEQLIKAGNNAELIAQIEANRKREKLEVTIDDKIKKLDFSEELESQRVAGLESIGMTELVEEKKLEITKRYLQLKIEALQELADAGNEDAKQQIQMYQASLKKLNMQKSAKSIKALADKAIFNTIQKGFEKAGDSAEDAEEKTTNLLGSIENKAAMVADITSMLQSAFGGMDEGLDMAMEAVGNIASGFAQGGIVGGIAAVVSEGIKLFGKASEAAARHKQALKEIEDARLASQRAYNLLLLEQNLLLKEAVSIFGEKQITRAANAIQNYRDSLGQLKDEMQGDFAPNAAYEQYLEKGASSGGILSKYFSNQLNDYRKQVDNYNKGIAKLAEATVVTGHKKTGLFGWGKGKDIYSSILDEYDDVIDAEGKLNIARIQNIIDTRKMSDETKNYLQNLIDLQDAAEAAQEESRNYLQSTFGTLGEDIMTSLENAIKDKGIDAWEAFGEAGAKVIEELGKQIAYELFFADKFKELQNQLEAVYGSGKSEKDIARDAMDLVGKFYQNIGSQMELAQGFMENWQKEAEKYGLNLWKPEDDSKTQNSTKGYSVSMDQDTGGAILGRITGMHESILEVKSMMSEIKVDTAKSLIQSIVIGDELKKHTGIFYEMQQMQVKSYRISESMNEGITSLLDIKDDIASINKNTKGLAPRN